PSGHAEFPRSRIGDCLQITPTPTASVSRFGRDVVDSVLAKPQRPVTATKATSAVRRNLRYHGRPGLRGRVDHRPFHERCKARGDIGRHGSRECKVKAAIARFMQGSIFVARDCQRGGSCEIKREDVRPQKPEGAFWRMELDSLIRQRERAVVRLPERLVQPRGRFPVQLRLRSTVRIDEARSRGKREQWPDARAVYPGSKSHKSS